MADTSASQHAPQHVSIQDLIECLTQLLHTATQTATPTPRLPKVTSPNPYDGNREKLDDFLGQCRLYLTLRDDDYPSDIKKILFILSYMKEGSAAPSAAH